MQSKVIKETEHKTSFIVMPKHLNYMDIIFGGAFMSELDLAAAALVNKVIRQSPTADKAVTFKFSVEFAAPTFAGDLVNIVATIQEVRKKAIRVRLEAWREPRIGDTEEKVAVAETIFVAMRDNNYVPHGLELKTP